MVTTTRWLMVTNFTMTDGNHYTMTDGYHTIRWLMATATRLLMVTTIRWLIITTIQWLLNDWWLPHYMMIEGYHITWWLMAIATWWLIVTTKKSKELMSGERGGHPPSEIKRSSKKDLSSSNDFFDTCGRVLSCWNQQRQFFLLRYASERFGRVNRQHLSNLLYSRRQYCFVSHKWKVAHCPMRSKLAYQTCYMSTIHTFGIRKFFLGNLSVTI